jgi:teichuronic acid biosynthesis glycosyltransferase TuaG
MKNYYKIDIILPVYNSKNFIFHAINSIISQTYKNWKLIIVDDKSNDGTRELIEQFIRSSKYKKKILFIKNDKNIGQGLARNLALKKTNSKYIAFIDSDDIWEKNKLKKQIKFMIDNHYDFTYTDYISLKKKKKKIIITPNSYNYASFINNTSIATSTMIVEKKILKNIFFLSLRLCEDYYFKCQILRKTISYKCPKVYSFYRLRNNSLQSSRMKVLFAVWNINKKLNKIGFINNLISIFSISYNSFRKYGLR